MKHRWYILLLTLLPSLALVAAEPTVVTVHPTDRKQEFHGMGCGTIFYSGHITSLEKRNRHKLQEQFYDELFTAVRTRYLHLMIRPAFEPQNDNDDPFVTDFPKDAFKANQHALDVCKAARKRRPDMQLFATLYTPPNWMKTNGKETGGGKEKATLKPGLELELGEYIWAYLRHMKENGEPVHYLSICNESDWAHDQPSYFLTPEEHADLFLKLAKYLDEMARRVPSVPRPKLVAPNMLSAVGTAKRYWPAMQKVGATPYVDVVGAHDYDRRGHRWKTLRDVAGDLPLWCTEWCWNGKDTSPDLLKSASEFWLVMTEAFNDGANVWMAYDWAYPPRDGGEALTHVDWGKSYHKTRIYHGFRQWSNPLAPGMRLVSTTLSGPYATGISTPGVKASAFIDPDGRRLVIHVVNLQDRPADVALEIADARFNGAKMATYRTSSEDACTPYPKRAYSAEGVQESFKAREMVTYIIAP